MPKESLLTVRRIARLLVVSEQRARQCVESDGFPPPYVVPGVGRRWKESDVWGWLNGKRGQNSGHTWTELDGVVATPGRTVAKPAVPAVSKTTSEDEEMAEAILRELREANGKWVHGRDLERAIGGTADRTQGTWRRAVAILKGNDPPLIVTSKSKGYKLIES